MGLISTYVINMLGYMIVAFPLYLIVRLVILKKRKKPVKKSQEVILALFVLYLVGLASQTIMPKWNMGVDVSTGEFFFDVYMSNQLAHVNTTPFHTITSYMQVNEYADGWDSISNLNLLGNVFVFSPIGFFIPLLWRRMDSFKVIFFIGLGVTCIIESIQYFIGRSSDIDDVILNTVGVVIGYWAYILYKGIVKLFRVGRRITY